MDLIDKKLYKRGFTIQNVNSEGYAYLKPLADGIGHLVEIKDVSGAIYILSSMSGSTCYSGRKCSMPLGRMELALFLLKMVQLRLYSWFKKHFKRKIKQ